MINYVTVSISILFFFIILFLLYRGVKKNNKILNLKQDLLGKRPEGVFIIKSCHEIQRDLWVKRFCIIFEDKEGIKDFFVHHEKVNINTKYAFARDIRNNINVLTEIH